MLYPEIKAIRKTGEERFTSAGRVMDLTLLDFWKWSISDLISNATRGRLAEFIVASALNVEHDVREEWAAFDIQTANGIKVEVKSASYMQSWAQNSLSKVHFRCGAALLWEKETNRQGLEKKRWADAYVFALLHHTERQSLNPLNLDQWEFYVLPTKILDARTRSQHSITLKSLKDLAPAWTYAELTEKFYELIKPRAT